MKAVFVLCALVVAVCARPDGEKYTTKYDNLDVDEILSNRRLLLPYVKCGLEQGKCSPEGKELKSHLKEALENNCKLCTDKQKEETQKVIKHLIKHEAELWAELRAKYDPEGKYYEQHKSELESIA